VATEGISYTTDSNGNLKVFNVERNDDGLWLNSNYANPENFYNGDNVWVFARKYLCFFRRLTEVLF
jgi:hypothetical protein